MFTNDKRQEERTGKYKTPRVQYLQELVSRFQNASDEGTKEQVVGNEMLVEFGIRGICNCSADPANAAFVTQSGGIPLFIQCLSSPVRNTVCCGLGALYYLCNELNREEILKPEVVDVIKRYAAASEVSASFSNLAQAFLDKFVSDRIIPKLVTLPVAASGLSCFPAFFIYVI
ncbi:unnamed protein product [Cuscuta europaea]|uniref:Armadillo repeat-containing protein 7 n=1 Tax=Cuscuta europaea TaxID=41803 RepID=A0A9P0ZFV8_CUSEU|nr:unnamed protein product [Cuscuta europaea]